MTANVTVTFSNASGFPTIPDDERLEITDQILLERTLFSDFEGSTISLDISYTAEVDDGLGNLVPANVSNNVCTFDFSSIGLSYTKLSANTARVSGTVINVFPGTYFEFRMPDGTFKILEPDTTEDWFALVEYNMPDVTVVLKSYPVTIAVDETIYEPKQNVSFDLEQYHFWNFVPAVATVKNLVSRGKQ